jgi:ketosteroid isomerase-like protein
MRFSVVCAAVALAAVLASTGAQSQTATGDGESSFRAFLEQFEQGTRQFINGDPGPWLHHASRRDDVTLMGGWGTYERGWKSVGERYTWAAARFRNSNATLKVEHVSSGVSGDLAYTISIERSVVRVADQAEAAPMTLRVTHLFRREAGTWMLIHRHADPLMDTTAPGSVLQKP